MAQSRRRAAEATLIAPGWTAADSARYPLIDQVKIAPFDHYGLGIGTWLKGIGPIAAGRVGQLAACLQHPESTVNDAAVEALGSMGVVAQPSLPALLAYVRQCGTWDEPFPPGIAIARIVPDDPDVAEQMARDIDPLGDTNQVAGPCAVLRLLRHISPAVIGVVLEKLHAAASPQNHRHLLVTGAELAARIHHATTTFR